MIAEELFVECWRAGLSLELNENNVVIRGKPGSRISEDLKIRLKEHKKELLRFLAPNAWIETPYGPAKFVMFLNDGRGCGVVLKNRPDRVTWIERSELRFASATMEGEVVQ